jgi:hypothetical protein
VNPALFFVPETQVFPQPDIRVLPGILGRPSEPVYWMFRVCCECGKDLDPKRCSKKQHGTTSHGYCNECRDEICAQLEALG